MTESTPGASARPLSPHMQVWRWHVTMLCSILHRATGVALYVGALILAGWAIALASGPEAYLTYKEILGSLIGKLVLFGLIVSIFYHLAAGLRHLVMDAGAGFDPRTADMTGAASIAFGIVAAVAVWVGAHLLGVF
jgi:succinate dehydrogenase / fumarate reductase cytochrome b subunit